MSVVLRGEVWARRMHVTYLVEALSETHPSVSPKIADRRALSKREEEVLRLVTAGATDREISNSLKLNEKESRKCVSDVLGKLRPLVKI
jgi:DNA-binding NarL/FixJ family response regulator